MILNNMKKIEIKIDDNSVITLQNDKKDNFTGLECCNIKQEDITQLHALVQCLEKAVQVLKGISDCWPSD